MSHQINDIILYDTIQYDMAGLDSNGASYLDRIRIIVTEIGNALGYVRLVSAVLSHVQLYSPLSL